MANEMPASAQFTGLSRTVIEYSEAFSRIIAKVRAGTLVDADWQAFEPLVAVDAFERIGVFSARARR